MSFPGFSDQISKIRAENVTPQELSSLFNVCSSSSTALYSPVRAAVPLRPRLHCPNSHRVAQTSILQPIAAAPSGQASTLSRPLAGLKSSPLAHRPLSVSKPLSATPHFERSPSAARQLQIIALSSTRQPGAFAHTSVQPAADAPERSAQSKRTLSPADILPPPPLNPSLPKTTPPLPSPPTLLSPGSPQTQAEPHLQNLTQKVETKQAEEQREQGRGVRQGVRDEGSVAKDLRVEKDDQREKVKEEKPTEEQMSQQEQEVRREEDQMEVTEEGQSERREDSKEKKMEEDEEGETPMDQSDNQTGPLLHQHHNTDPVPVPDPVKDSSVDSKPITGLISAPGSIQTPVPAPAPVLVPAPAPVPEVSAQTQRLQEPHKDLQPVSQEDFCESMSTQSDNQSGTSTSLLTAARAFRLPRVVNEFVWPSSFCLTSVHTVH